VARLELVRVRLDDAVVVVARLDVEVELVWLALESRAPEISRNAVFRSVKPWFSDEDEEALDEAEAAADVVDDDASPEAPVLCSEVRRDSIADENWSDGDDCCGGGGGGPPPAGGCELPLPCTFCPLGSALLAGLAEFVSSELISACRVCRAEELETLEVCTFYSLR
jgi:hypothetical protein